MNILDKIVIDKELFKLILEDMYNGDAFENEEREEKALKDIQWTMIFLSESMKVNNINILNNYFVWLTKLFKSLHIDYEHIPLLLESMKKVLWSRFHDQDIRNFLELVELNENKEAKELLEENPYLEEKNLYLQYILDSKRYDAEKLIMDVFEKGVSIEDIYTYIFQESLRNVGMLWHDGSISVGREHYCTAVTQYIMSSLYPTIFTNEVKSKKLLACAVGSELHEIGIRMVADIFELNGWNTNYLGTNIPTPEVIKFAKEFKPDLIALSITMPYHLSVLAKTIDDIKKDPELKEIKIIVGGLPFLNNKEIYKEIGADAVALSGSEGVKIANDLL